MTPEQFCYWLNGFFELGVVRELTAEQSQMIYDHLKLVFNQITDTPIKIDVDKLKEGIKKTSFPSAELSQRNTPFEFENTGCDLNKRYC